MVLITFLLSFFSWLFAPVLKPESNLKPLTTSVSADKNLASENIAWSSDRRLNWDDFKGLPEEGNPHHAVTAANLAVDAKCSNNEFVYEVKCVFLATQSWSKNKKSEKLLYHEQLHFDLTEVHARLLRKKLAALGTTCTNMKDRMNPTVAEAFKTWKAEQLEFDELSRHGLDAEVQQVWADNISKRLQELEAYKKM
ncbi:DUF922 domain-containing protein [Pontibacter sp. SGAir0037]|uniref:DUF922 domain-containing protein n=1 Tax=Pontibacter sp. SGAir0037 TaxID=2571030 RepID=UPI0010CD18E6|nr:DUF922 domain-containing protein [Pontibacter sp. SGAir0037]QCR21742.1 hypothetical protein C1N53_04890 [Pontibacter sp. SGAir0037]